LAIVEQDIERALPQRILHLNRGTEYGQCYQFARIAAPKSYRQAENAVCKAVSEVTLQSGANLVDFTAMVDYEVFPCRYTFYVEIGYPAQDAECSETLLKDVLHHASSHYHSIRQADQLGQLALRAVRTGTFEKLKKALIARGTAACQVKIPRVIRDRELGSLLAASALHTTGDALPAV
jgi:hypothetical protein